MVPILTPPDHERLTGLRSLPVVSHPSIFRATLAREMEEEGLNPGQISDMVQAASEVVVNALQHGGGLRAVRIGRVSDRFVCEVTDQNGRLDDPLAGYIAPAHAEHSSGLWIARQLTWRLQPAALVSRPHRPALDLSFGRRVTRAAAVGRRRAPPRRP